jgi:hypothetical protein
VTATTLAAARARRTSCVVHLESLRVRSEAAVAAVAAAPVRHLPAALLEALQGSWGTPEELGLVQEPGLRLVAG